MRSRNVKLRGKLLYTELHPKQETGKFLDKRLKELTKISKMYERHIKKRQQPQARRVIRGPGLEGLAGRISQFQSDIIEDMGSVSPQSVDYKQFVGFCMGGYSMNKQDLAHQDRSSQFYTVLSTREFQSLRSMPQLSLTLHHRPDILLDQPSVELLDQIAQLREDRPLTGNYFFRNKSQRQGNGSLRPPKKRVAKGSRVSFNRLDSQTDQQIQDVASIQLLPNSLISIEDIYKIQPRAPRVRVEDYQKKQLKKTDKTLLDILSSKLNLHWDINRKEILKRRIKPKHTRANTEGLPQVSQLLGSSRVSMSSRAD